MSQVTLKSYQTFSVSTRCRKLVLYSLCASQTGSIKRTEQDKKKLRARIKNSPGLGGKLVSWKPSVGCGPSGPPWVMIMLRWRFVQDTFIRLLDGKLSRWVPSIRSTLIYNCCDNELLWLSVSLVFPIARWWFCLVGEKEEKFHSKQTFTLGQHLSRNNGTGQSSDSRNKVSGIMRSFCSTTQKAIIEQVVPVSKEVISGAVQQARCCYRCSKKWGDTKGKT